MLRQFQCWAKQLFRINREFFEMMDRSCSDKIGNQIEWSAKGTCGAFSAQEYSE